MKHEGLRLFPYPDPLNPQIITIGVGRNLTARGINEEEAMLLLENDIDLARIDLEIIFTNFHAFSENRINALIDMRFNLGRGGFLKFANMIEAINDGDWVRAAKSIRNSLWHSQLPGRVDELAGMVETG